MKKGFTLIELLAVILILGIIALIAIPTVNNILKESRRGAFQSTLTNLEKAIEEQCTVEQIKNIEINKTYTINDGKISPNVEIKGELPDGTISLDNECSVSYILFNNNFTGVKNKNEEVQIYEDKIYLESTLNGATPVLGNNLIPVTIENDGTVKKADIFKKWYSYAEKKWANAVILTNNGKVETDGTILEDSIESYFVWIPRYKYKLFDLGNYDSYIEGTPSSYNAKQIEVVFENKNTSPSTGTEVDQYHSHPAFQAFDTNGFWVGKFETTGTLDAITIKPNKVALRQLNINTMFLKALSYNESNTSHMMKNTEWGAVAYLAHSIYGRCNGTTCEEININNHSKFTTGYSAVSGTDQSDYPGTYGETTDVTLPYNTETGYLASSTGNITGVYDMSGGSHEYMASFIEGLVSESGFTQDPTIQYGNKYFDTYANDNSKTYSKRILGDATGEMGPFYRYQNGNGSTNIHNAWYSDRSSFAFTTQPWFHRGSAFSVGALSGQFSFASAQGKADSYLGFRIVLAN